MFLHPQTTAQSRLRTYGKNGSAEHLFALIDLCKLIEQHKELILARAEPRETDELDEAQWHRPARRAELAQAIIEF
jgi:hypothetical protein